MISFPCAGCGRSLSTEDADVGRRMICPGCRGVVVVPGGQLPSPFIPTAVPVPAAPIPSADVATLQWRQPDLSAASTRRRTRSSWATIVGCVVVLAGVAIAGEAAYRFTRFEQRQANEKPPPRDSFLGEIDEGVDRLIVRILWERFVVGTLFALVGAAIVKIDCDVPR